MSRTATTLALAVACGLWGWGVADTPAAGALPAHGSPGGATFRDGPPAAVTGGFGEDSCHACHFEAEENDPAGRLVLNGVPDRFQPGETYALHLTVTRPDMAVAGFQLAARFVEDGRQAGALRPGPEEEGRVGVIEEREVQYIQHLLEGIALEAPDTATWTLLWTAPVGGGGVLLHAAAVAGDDDESQMGDYVYTTKVRSRPHPGRGDIPPGRPADHRR